MKIKFDKIVDKVDDYQRSHKIPGFLYALQTKYTQDNGGQQAALLTYYAFLSIFPLLLVATSVLQIVLNSHPGVRDSFVSHATQYFPVLGEQLQTNVHHVSGTGIGLVVGIILTLWGAKGVADVFQTTMNHLWGIPMNKRPGFPQGPLKSVAMVVAGGVGFVAASFLSSFAFSLDKIFIFRLLSIAVSIVLLFFLFWLMFKWSLADSSLVDKHSIIVSAMAAAILIQILQMIGGYLITHELSNLKHLYGTFAATLGLLFWLYMQARVIVYSAEAGMVSARKLWPRSINRKRLTQQDKEAFSGYAKKEKYVDPEKIDVEFQQK